jgi:hypothetical protein
MMANSRYVISANSTFSWWGAYVSKKLGGRVYIPRPWHFDFGIQALTDSAFEFIDAGIVIADFEK